MLQTECSSGPRVGGSRARQRQSTLLTRWSRHTRTASPCASRGTSFDPLLFGGGTDFYAYVCNRPVQLGDPQGLSPRDVKRIKDACKRCTASLTAAGLRLNGGSTTIGKVITGGINDLLSWLGPLAGNKQACYSQAAQVQPCLEANPHQPYDDPWFFDIVPIWHGTHNVILAHDNNPSDPIIYCDPWLDRVWIVPTRGNR